MPLLAQLGRFQAESRYSFMNKEGFLQVSRYGSRGVTQLRFHFDSALIFTSAIARRGALSRHYLYCFGRARDAACLPRRMRRFPRAPHARQDDASSHGL